MSVWHKGLTGQQQLRVMKIVTREHPNQTMLTRAELAALWAAKRAELYPK